MKLIIYKRTIAYFLLAFIVAIIVAYRGNTRDTEMYINIFRNIYEYSLLSPIEFYNQAQVEVGYGFLAFFVNYIGLSEVFLFFLISFLTFFFIFKIIKEINLYSKVYYYIAFILSYLISGYFLMQQFMQIRQGLSIPIAIYAVLILVNHRNKINFIILSIISVAFHQSSFAILTSGVFVCFFINNIKFSLNSFKFFLFFSIFLLVILFKFILLDIIVGFSNRLIAYSHSVYSEARDIFSLPNIKSIMIFIFSILFLNYKLYINKAFRFIIILYSIGVAIRLGFSDFGVLSGRLGASFTFVEIFIIPSIIFSFNNRGRLFIFTIYLIVQFIITYYFQAHYIVEDYFKPLSN